MTGRNLALPVWPNSSLYTIVKDGLANVYLPNIRFFISMGIAFLPFDVPDCNSLFSLAQDGIKALTALSVLGSHILIETPDGHI